MTEILSPNNPDTVMNIGVIYNDSEAFYKKSGHFTGLEDLTTRQRLQH
jgi:hypothetical protein